nr:GNAT family N-acetyltransferase [Alteribacter aurantiacus]
MSLEVAESQSGYIERNEISILESVYDKEHHWYCYGLYEEETPVGFVMIGAENKEERYIWLDRFMIDKNAQGKGLGGAFLDLVVKFIAKHYDVAEIVLSVAKDNPKAMSFYQKYGFDKTGLIDPEFDEEIFVYKL